MTLEQLVRAAQTGDREAFARLVALYQRMVIATAWSVLRHFHAAQDAAQDTFVIAWSQLGTLRSPATFGSWLLTIAKREAIRHSRQSRILVPLEESPEPVTCEAPDWCQRNEELLTRLGELPEQEREVVIFHYLEGQSVRQISEFTDRPIGTITKQLSRAILRLRKTWKEELQ